MRENIIVTSNGFIDSSPRSEEIDSYFRERCIGKRVLIIDNSASSKEVSGNYSQRIPVQSNFINIAGASSCDIATIDASNTSIIQDYDVIYVLGGNLNPLIELVNTTDFKEQVCKFLEKGLYIGESAGSMILSSDLRYAYDVKKGTKPKYDIVPDPSTGLGLMDEFIIPHYNSISDSLREKVDSYPGCKITPLRDGTWFTISYSKQKKIN